MKHVTFHLPSFLRRVRIHGGEFDSSARAMNRVNGKGSLMTYARALAVQADLRIVRGSTIERKYMSTTIKRIALVAVAVLSLGVLSVAPSQATNLVLTFGTGDSAGTDNKTGFGVAGAFNYATVNVTGAAADYVLTTDSTFVGQGDASPAGVASADAKALSMTDTTITGIRVATPSVGTVTVSYWVRTGGILAATPAESVVITVNATKQSGTFSAANSTSIINTGETISATADATIAAVATANFTTAVATIAVSLADNLKTAFNDTVTATVIAGGANVRAFSNLANLSSPSTPGTVSQSVATVAGKAYIGVYASGIAGPAIIQISLSNGTVLATEAVTFSSTTVAKLEATVVNKYVSFAGKAGAITVVAKDAAGNVINGAVITATSGTTTAVASPSSATTTAGKASFTVGAASATAAGASVITFKSGTASTTASITAAGVKATKLTIVPSSEVANAGDKITYTMTVADANGPLADGDYVGVFVSAPVTSSGAVGAFASDTITVTDGVATSDIFLPFVAGNYTAVWTLKGVAGGAATNNLDATLVGTKITSTVVVANPGLDAATDAANESTDAANAATDAALAAAEAADAATSAAQEASDAVAALSDLVTELSTESTDATNEAIDAANAATDAALAAAEAADAATTAAQEASDAVAALSASVTKLIEGLQAQIKSLAAVVAKIAKKVKA